MITLNCAVGTFSAEHSLRGAGVAGAVVASVALAEGVVVDLHAGGVGVEGATRLAVEALLAQLLRWNQNMPREPKIVISGERP